MWNPQRVLHHLAPIRLSLGRNTRGISIRSQRGRLPPFDHRTVDTPPAVEYIKDIELVNDALRSLNSSCVSSAGYIIPVV